MNSYSSKRKREVEQSIIPEAASGVYQGLGMGVLDSVEAEPPRKRIQAGTDKTVLQNTLVTRNVDRGVNRLLSNEQIHQFINSTVIPQNRIIPNAVAATSVRNWSQYKPVGRPNQQVFPANDSQQFIRIHTVNNVQAQSLQYVQQSQKCVQKSQQYVQPVVISSRQSQQYMLPATAVMGYSFPQNNSVAQRQVTLQQHTSIPTSSNLQSGVQQQYVQIVSADGTSAQLLPVVQVVPQSDSAPKPKKARRKSKKVQPQGLPNGSGHPNSELTNQCHLSSHVSLHSPKTSQLDQFRSWHLTPHTVPTYVKPAEARTRHEIKSPEHTFTNISLGRAEIPKNFCQQDDTVSKHLYDGQQREATVNKSKAQSSTKKAGGKKNMERAVVPSKTKKDHVEYPPYVHRIMRILNRAEQRSQAEKNLKEKDSVASKSVAKDCSETVPEKCSQSTSNTGIPLYKTTEKQNRATECGEITEECTKPPSGCQRLPEMCNTSNTSQKCSPVKATECKQATADKCWGSIGDTLNQTCNKKQKKESNVTKVFPVESHVSKVFPVESHVSKVDVDKVLGELFPESSDVTLLEAGSFYGPELMITRDDFCFMAPFACC